MTIENPAFTGAQRELESIQLMLQSNHEKVLERQGKICDLEDRAENLCDEG